MTATLEVGLCYRAKLTKNLNKYCSPYAPVRFSSPVCKWGKHSTFLPHNDAIAETPHNDAIAIFCRPTVFSNSHFSVVFFFFFLQWLEVRKKPLPHQIGHWIGCISSLIYNADNSFYI